MITAFGAVLQALQHLGVHKVALGTPYAEDTSLKGKAHLEAHGHAGGRLWPPGQRPEHLRGNSGAGLRAGAAGRYR